jgi:hypothetical protein
MGIADQMGWSNPFTQFVGQNRNTLMGFGAGLAGGRTLGQGIAAGLEGVQRGAVMDDLAQQQRAEEEKRQEMISRYAQTLRSWGGEYADLAEGVEAGGIEPADAYMTAWQRRYAPAETGTSSAPANVQEWQYYSQLSPEEQSRYLLMKRANSPLNIGTGFVTQDPANPGATIGAPIAINNEQAAYDTAMGTGTGKSDAENVALAESVQSKLPGLRLVIEDLTNLADTATYTQSGQAMDAVKRELGLPVGQGAIDRASYIAIVDNQVLPLLRDTFGAAFTQREGESLRATLGDPNKSPAEKKAILNAFIAQKERDVAGMVSRMPGQAPQGGSVDDILKGYGL